MGDGLAGAALYYAGGDRWDKDFTFTVRGASVSGPQIGPAKRGRGAYQAFTNGHVAVSWNPGEVPLVPGERYFIEVTQSFGFNPVKFTKSVNAYPDGDAYRGGGRRSGVDLHMQVVEYAPVTPRFARADFDRDGDVDLTDFGRLQTCFTGVGVPPAPGACSEADLDQDHDVDPADLARFLGCMSGRDLAADTTCGR